VSFFDIKAVQNNIVKYSTFNSFCGVTTSLWDSYWKLLFMWHILFTFRNSGSTGRWEARNAAAEIALCKPVSLYSSRNSWQPSINSTDSHTWRFWLHILLLMMWIWNSASYQFGTVHHTNLEQCIIPIWNSASYQLPMTLKRLKSFNCWSRALA